MSTTTRFNNRERRLVNIFGLLVMVVLSIIIVVPFYYLLASSLKSLGQYALTDFMSMWFPSPLQFSNYELAWGRYKLPLYMWNSVWLATVQTTLQVATSAIVAYGFSRFKFPGRDSIFVLLMASMMLPTQVTQIPLYQLFRSLEWTNSFLPLIVPNFFANAWTVFLLRQMLLTLPKEIDEAAWIDGAGTWKTFTQVTIPQIQPALIVGALFGFLGSWKDLFGPLIYLSDANFFTLPLGLLFFQSPTDNQYTVQLAAVAIALVPTVVLYILGNRYFERGINVTDLK